MSFIPKVLIIAGSDSGGGAGIQADIKTTSYFKGFAMTAVTAITAQNTVGVQSIYPLPKQIVIDQINSINNDLGPDIIKIGMLADLEIIKYISMNLSNYKIVLDPVMVATSGDVLVSDEVITSIKNNLISKSFLITPNIYEAEILSEMKVNNVEDQIECGIKLLKLGCKNVLIKGGHGNSNNINDVLITSDGDEHIFESNKIKSTNTHGTGCSLASAIATNIALGNNIKESIKLSIDYVQSGIKNAPDFGSGNGPIRHF
ncbi:MAG: bifunctional hydroxymethylpyrimidine kinase/phosphomethylpyrimidine kinase [Gammaproteobacteria bacterium]|tara:strand:- start:69 stop:845 length:777 start_codon:yes stop_codon:yes gene_type:complete